MRLVWFEGYVVNAFLRNGKNQVEWYVEEVY